MSADVRPLNKISTRYASRRPVQLPITGSEPQKGSEGRGGSMRIHSWGQASGAGCAQAVSASNPQASCNASSAAASDCSEQVDLSKSAELIQKLSALKSSDPAAFKVATNKVAEHFDQLASMAQGPERVGLSQLSKMFASAAQDGDLSALQPKSSAAAEDCDESDEADAVEAPPAPPTPSPAQMALAAATSLVDSLTASPTGETTGEPMARLAALKSASPASFKQVMNRVAEGLGQLADMAQGADKESLSALAGSFADAAETGDISAFAPASPAAPAAPPSAPPPPPPPAIDPYDTALALVDDLTAPTATGLTSDPLQKLKELKGSDHGSFVKVMNQVAERLDQLTSFAEGDTRDGLAQLAGIFASGSETGDLSALEPAVEQAPAAPPANNWLAGHALSAYHRHGPSPASPQAIQDAYASAMALIS
jgi:hypothetical protein